MYSICVCSVEEYATTQYIICPSIGVCTMCECAYTMNKWVCNVYVRVIFVHVCTMMIL